MSKPMQINLFLMEKQKLLQTLAAAKICLFARYIVVDNTDPGVNCEFPGFYSTNFTVNCKTTVH